MSKNGNALPKEAFYHGIPGEDAYGYPQGIKVGNSIYVSGQLSHDAAGQIVGPAELDQNGRPADFSMMKLQMEKTYANAKTVLESFGATFDNVVEETLFVLDVDAAFVVAKEVRSAVYGTDKPLCASNLIGVSRLAFPTQLIEIAFRAQLEP